jgi:hypothetical protein
MKLFLINILLLVSVASGLFGQDCKSKIHISTDDSSSLIFIGEKFFGKGNSDIELPRGKYVVLIKESFTKWDGYELKDTVEINDCRKTYSFNFIVPKKVLVDSDPQNAQIISKDSVIGATPGFVDLNKYSSLILKAGNDFMRLNKDELMRGEIHKINFTPDKKEISFTDSDLFKILIGSATALGVSAAYLKIKADKKYDNYLADKNKTTLDDVDRLDLYSGISFALLQINIGYLVYRFLSD